MKLLTREDLQKLGTKYSYVHLLKLERTGRFPRRVQIGGGRNVAWRIFWMTIINRVERAAPTTLVLTPFEMKVLNRVRPDKNNPAPADLLSYIRKIARLGGYLARANDPPPGNKVIWRGMTKLADIVFGAEIGAGLVGN